MSEPIEQDFWQRLRHASSDWQQAERSELAEAERMLDALDDEDEQMPRERVDALAERALAEAAPERPAARVLRSGPWQRALASAAAVLVAPKFLAAATTVAVITASVWMLRYTTESLPFQDAVGIVLDESRPAEARRTAAGRVFFDIVESIELLRVAAEPSRGAHAVAAQAQLERLRVELGAATPFRQATFSSSLSALADRIVAANERPRPADADDAVAAVTRLADQLVFGMRALREVLDRGGPDELEQVVTANLQQLEDLLAR